MQEMKIMQLQLQYEAALSIAARFSMFELKTKQLLSCYSSIYLLIFF